MLLFRVHCLSSLSCMNEYLGIDIGVGIVFVHLRSMAECFPQQVDMEFD